MVMLFRSLLLLGADAAAEAVKPAACVRGMHTRKPAPRGGDYCAFAGAISAQKTPRSCPGSKPVA
jgi:hypothetical protein